MPKTYGKSELTGGSSSALDGLDGSILSEGDRALVITSSNEIHFYRLDEDSGLSESSPDVIAPDVNAGLKRWIKISFSGMMSELLDDTTPQLGGQLDVNGFAIGDGTLELIKFTETALAVNEITVKNAATGNAPEIQASGDDTNIDLKFIPKGAGTISVAGTTDYENNVSDDDDIPNKKYVDDNTISDIVDDTTPQLGGDLDLNSHNITFPSITVSDCLDEDDMASNSDTKLATQQSIKAYADTKLANVVEDTSPQLGGDLEYNGKHQIFDISLSASGTAAGDIITVTFGESVVFGKLCYPNATDNEWKKGLATNAATTYPALGIALESKGDGESGKLLLRGTVRDDTLFAGVAAGDILYLSDTSSGDIVTTAPGDSGDIVQIVGFGLGAGYIFFNPDPTYVEVA